jgi:hypothetical protein
MRRSCRAENTVFGGVQFPLPDELPPDHLPEPVALTPEQTAALGAMTTAVKVADSLGKG